MAKINIAMLIEQAKDASLTQEAELQDKALNECESLEDWEACLEAFGSRVVGSYVADNADAYAYHPYECGGIAYCEIEGKDAIVSQWNDQGFYDVSFVDLPTADSWVDERNAEWNTEDEEEDEG
jgi:hypothetical protein